MAQTETKQTFLSCIYYGSYFTMLLWWPLPPKRLIVHVKEKGVSEKNNVTFSSLLLAYRICS